MTGSIDRFILLKPKTNNMTIIKKPPKKKTRLERKWTTVLANDGMHSHGKTIDRLMWTMF